MEPIKYEDFAKLDLRVATITDAQPIEGADKLVLLTLDDGTEGGRQIVAGIKKHFPLDDESKKKLIGVQIVIVANLEPRKMRGVVSNGMLLAASNGDELQLLTTTKVIAPGSKVG
jgi:methionyl-tRNA synthetase